MSSRKSKPKPKPKAKPVYRIPAWGECHACGDRYCTYHDMHVFECPCPPIEWWTEKGLWPYDPMTKKQAASVQRKPRRG